MLRLGDIIWGQEWGIPKSTKDEFCSLAHGLWRQFQGDSELFKQW